MDSIVSGALSVICSQGVNGILLKDLWPKLHDVLTSSGLQLCDGVKRAIWNGVLKIPGLEFKVQNSNIGSEESSIQSFEECEKKCLKIVAGEHLRDSFVGLYDLKAADVGISPPQRRALERLAIAGSDGITQNQLAKEFGMKGNNIFYVVRNLECQGLIVRQSTIVRTKEAGADGESASKNTSIVNTNLMHLYRYAKHLSSQQRLEITKANTLDNPTSDIIKEAGEFSKDDVLIKDYLPALKAVCDKLEKANGKVLVVSDIKKELGYRKSAGHRAWRNVFNRLKDAGLVEEFRAEAPEKVENCLRLLKKFDPKHFQPKSVASDDVVTDHPVRCGKRGEITEQLLELPIEHQVYDLIAAEGTKGLTVTEVCKRLGLNNKRYYTRLLNMFSRFGLHIQSETHNRSVLYRVWTPGNFNACLSTATPIKHASVVDVDGISLQGGTDIVLHENSDPPIPQSDFLASKEKYAIPGKIENEQIRYDFSRNSLEYDEGNQMLTCGSNQHDVVREVGHNDAEYDIARTVTESNVVQSETTPPASLSVSKSRSYPYYPCLTLTAAGVLRGQRILERLQEEKFVLEVELYKWLESLDNDKPTKMDRKTLTRTLNKLQLEGHCKCIEVSVPVVTNCGSIRKEKVVLHKSVQSLPPDFSGQIHERVRSFDMQSRRKGLARLKNKKSVPVLSGITRTSNLQSSDSLAVKAEAMRANGFVLAKMVRAKLLHTFLWSCLNSSPDWDCALSSGRHGYDLKNPHSTCKKFALDVAIKAMPVAVFLQVVGSSQNFANLAESCKCGLNLSDLPGAQYKALMDTQATVRLSGIVDILRRLKLVRLVTDGQSEDADMRSTVTLTHTMELKPYIEEPLSRVSMSFGVCSLDLRPRIRHDFILSNLEAVDRYWKTLEYSYATADPTSAIHAFPGSSVHEVLTLKAWASAQVITAEQRAEVLKRVTEDVGRKISFADCVKIATELNLTLDQVLRVSDDKRQSRLRRSQTDFNSNEHASRPLRRDYKSASRKRRRTLKARSSKRKRVVTDGNCTEENTHSLSPSEDDDGPSQAREDGHATSADDLGDNEENREDCDLISQVVFPKLKPTRNPKFAWTESSERQLLIAYVRNRAALGARYHRTDWVSLPGLPAPPSTCRRRMARVNKNQIARRAVLRLCNLLSERYVRHLKKFQEKALIGDDSTQFLQTSSVDELIGCNLPGHLGGYTESDLEVERWDDFDNEVIKTVLDEVLHCIQMAKLEGSWRAGSALEQEWVDKNLNTRASDSQELDTGPSSAKPQDMLTYGGKQQRRSRGHRLTEKFLKHLDEGIGISRREYESLAVANAVELLKLIYLNTSTAPEIPNLLAETLRRYSEHDLFAAFNYLRQKKFMVGGIGIQPFILSQNFLHIVSSSPFPVNTGKRAANFASWLCERERDLMEEELHLNADFQCGDIFYLMALVSAEEFLISPCLPKDGIGEAEEKRSAKCKSDDDELRRGGQVKKSISFLMNDSEFVSRREKGFPGIKVSLNRVKIPKADTMDMFKNDNSGTTLGLHDENYEAIYLALSDGENFPVTGQLNPSINFDTASLISGIDNESPWNAMIRYSECVISSLPDKEQLSPLSPDLFKSVHSTIRKSGDQGLTVEEVSKVREMQGDKMAELVVDVLQAFGLVIKVNGYNHVHIVDYAFRSKYLLSSVDGQDLKPPSPCMKSSRISDANDATQLQEYRENPETSMDAMHKVTLLNLPEESPQLSYVPYDPKGDVRCEDDLTAEAVFTSTGNREGENVQCMIPDSSNSFWPILPWINGDGSTNPVVYKGLTRRVFGIVMQNPAMLEDDIIRRMPVLNPQSCRKLLELMILDNHLIVKKMHQTPSNGPPTILGSLFGSRFKKPESICKEHFFANPKSTALL